MLKVYISIQNTNAQIHNYFLKMKLTEAKTYCKRKLMEQKSYYQNVLCQFKILFFPKQKIGPKSEAPAVYSIFPNSTLVENNLKKGFESKVSLEHNKYSNK